MAASISSKKPIWIEGPHIYKRDGWYYLSCAEGGTGPQHSQVVLRARSPWGPFEPYAGNPILTQRDLPADRPHPITNAGHADLVEAPDGSWWATFLATRTYDGVHYNTGRETFLLPVTWRDGWPIDPRARPRDSVRRAGPNFMDGRRAGAAVAATSPGATSSTRRRSISLAAVARAEATVVRSAAHAGCTRRIDPQRTRSTSLRNPSFLARRQQHLDVRRQHTAAMLPANARYGRRARGVPERERTGTSSACGARATVEMFLEKSNGGTAQTVATATLKPHERLQLKISGDGRAYSFFYDAGNGWTGCERTTTASILSTDVAGGFVGAMIGPYARVE